MENLEKNIPTEVQEEFDSEYKSFLERGLELKIWLETSQNSILSDDEYFLHTNNAIGRLQKSLDKMASLKRELHGAKP